MDMSAFLNVLFSTENPVLPSATALRIVLHLVWAIVLGSGTLLLTGKLVRPYRFGLAGLVLVWTALPGAVSPAHWLGLAFQTPSLTSAGICLRYFFSRARIWQELVSTQPAVLAKPAMAGTNILAFAGVVLGWVLLLDTLAWLPLSVYAWGFGSAALAAILLFPALPWVFVDMANANPGAIGRFFLLLPFFVLALFVLTRLPSGNLWDALIDPWLWLALQGWWLVHALRRCKAGRLSH